jgi:hypothetical protein
VRRHEEGDKRYQTRVLGYCFGGTILHCADVTQIFQHATFKKEYGVIDHEHKLLA